MRAAVSFRTVRIIVLLAVLAIVAGVTYWESWSVRQWSRPLTVRIYPVNGDASIAVQRYVAGLTPAQFQEIGFFLSQESKRYRLQPLQAPKIILEAAISALPPAPPTQVRNIPAVLLWSLQLRYYEFRNTQFWQDLGQIKLFVVYHEGKQGVPLESSLGLRKGLFGIVHAFAQIRQNAQNNVVITHELLHTLGATDEYDANLMPLFPDGYGDPEASPLFPQTQAEIMAGRIAISPSRAIIPDNLGACVIGPKTAYQIHWANAETPAGQRGVSC